MKVEIFNLGRWLSIEGDLRVYVKKLNPTDIWEVGIRKEIGERGGGYLEGIVARFKEHARAEQYKELWQRIMNGNYRNIRTITQISENGKEEYKVIYRDNSEEVLGDFSILERELLGVEK